MCKKLPKKFQDFRAANFGVYKRNYKKYNENYFVGPFLLSFLTETSNQFKCYIFNAFFKIHLYWPHLTPYSRMAIWPYVQNMVKWPYGHTVISYQIWPLLVLPKTAIKMQQSGEGIKSIWPSCLIWEQKLSAGIYSFVFLRNYFVIAKNGSHSLKMV